ncbi:MAG: NUDIX hydrolase [Acidimicrobiia bacterium]|nr:NUDIX hydrolase [Acidimicrobiia bacterium]
MIEAAGGVVWRRTDEGGLEVLLVHRPRYHDWSLPKGKLEPGETHPAAAVREVAEETGLICSTGAELPEVSYRDRKDRPKRVRYWAMEVRSGTFAINDEVDEVRWLSLDAAISLLTYQHDEAVVLALESP